MWYFAVVTVVISIPIFRALRRVNTEVIPMTSTMIEETTNLAQKASLTMENVDKALEAMQKIMEDLKVMINNSNGAVDSIKTFVDNIEFQPVTHVVIKAEKKISSFIRHLFLTCFPHISVDHELLSGRENAISSLN
jgi:phage-related minor tail protein